MHVHDSTLPFSRQGACPGLGQGEKGAALSPQSHLVLVRWAPAHPMCPPTPLGTQGSTQRQSSSALVCHGHGTWHRCEFIFAVSQHRERMSFPQFHRLGGKEGKGKLKHPRRWGQCDQAYQIFLIFQSFTTVFSTLQLSWAFPATAQVFRLVPWVSSQIPRIWRTLKLATTHEEFGLSNLPGITLAEALKVLIP